jgi:hypothetical protein
MPKVQALAWLLHDAGIDWGQADEITSAIDQWGLFEDGSDHLADLLLRWRQKLARAHLAAARKRMRAFFGDVDFVKASAGLAASEQAVEVSTDIEGELTLFAISDKP